MHAFLTLSLRESLAGMPSCFPASEVERIWAGQRCSFLSLFVSPFICCCFLLVFFSGPGSVGMLLLMLMLLISTAASHDREQEKEARQAGSQAGMLHNFNTNETLGLAPLLILSSSHPRLLVCLPVIARSAASSPLSLSLVLSFWFRSTKGQVRSRIAVLDRSTFFALLAAALTAPTAQLDSGVPDPFLLLLQP